MKTRLSATGITLAILLSGCSSPPSLTEQKVRGDLIGHEATRGVCTWNFNDPNEIKSLTISGIEQQGDIVIASVSSVLEDANTHKQYTLKMRLTYRNSSDGSSLAAIAVDQYEPHCGPSWRPLMPARPVEEPQPQE